MTSSLPPCPTPRVEFELCASSVSSSSLSPTNSLPPPFSIPRPDSPRLQLSDIQSVARARISQLAVWGDAAEEEREEEDTILTEEIQPTDASDRMGDRLADRKRQSSYGYRHQSVFCARRSSSTNLGVTRKPSLWDLSRPDRPALITTQPSPFRRSSFSMRRGKSFHRFSRISGHSSADKDRSSRGFRHSLSTTVKTKPVLTEFDDLTEGLGAKKVVERPIVGQS